MKVSQIIFASLLLCLFGIGFVHSQDNSKKDKAKDNKSAPKLVEVKANLMVLDADGKFADIKLEDLKIFEDGVEQKITYFAKKENALNIGLLVDNTGSMRPNFNEILRVSSTIVSNLRPQDEAFVVRFTDSDTIQIIQNWTSNKKELNSAIENLYIEGGQSAIIDAIYLSAEEIFKREKQDKSKRYALILISDGEERDSYYKSDEIFSLFKENDVQIFMLSYAAQAPLAPKKAAKLSVQLAFETGGVSYALGKKKNEDGILSALKAISTELSSQYIIGYTSTNQKRDGIVRKLSVQVADGAKGEKRQAITRETFVVPKGKIK